jgi:MFS family permease
MMGYIFAFYSIAVVIFSPFIGKIVGRSGRRNLITFGVFLMGVSFILFGLAAHITDYTYFLLASFATRFLQGVASSSI